MGGWLVCNNVLGVNKCIDYIVRFFFICLDLCIVVLFICLSKFIIVWRVWNIILLYVIKDGFGRGVIFMFILLFIYLFFLYR